MDKPITLTPDQRRLLRALGGAGNLDSIDSIDELIAAGLVEVVPCPHTTDWRVTPAGRAAMEE